jgi:Flp pilus assembly protein TadG
MKMAMRPAFLRRAKTRQWAALSNRLRALRYDAGGVAAIEFAVMAPTLVMMAICTVDLGMGIYRNMQVQDAAQAGAQYAMRHDFDANQLATVVSNATGLSGVSASPAPVQYCGCASSTGVAHIACGSTCPTGAVYGNYVQVSSQATYQTILPYPMIANSFTLTAQSNVRVQ